MIQNEKILFCFLSVGQKIQHKNNPYPHQIIQSVSAGMLYVCYYQTGDIDQFGWEELKEKVKKGEYKILGREPTLSDVLMVLQEKYPNLKNPSWPFARAYNLFFEMWNLKQNLHGQELETLQFLYDLLYTK